MTWNMIFDQHRNEPKNLVPARLVCAPCLERDRDTPFTHLHRGSPALGVPSLSPRQAFLGHGAPSATGHHVSLRRPDDASFTNRTFVAAPVGSRVSALSQQQPLIPCLCVAFR